MYEHAPQASAAWPSSRTVLAGAKEQQRIRDECTEGCSMLHGGFNLQLGFSHALQNFTIRYKFKMRRPASAYHA